MARIAGVNIPTNKHVDIALRYIYGIGPTNAKDICEKVGIGEGRRVSDLTEAEVIQIRETIEVPLFLAGGLKAENVADAIRQVRPFGVDVCSGVRTDGKLDEGKLKAFFAAVRETK